NIKDILALKVEVCGKRRNEETHYIYYLLDHCEQKQVVSAMARTTAYPASILAQLIARGEIKAKGVVPLETLSVEEKLFNRIMVELEKRQIKIVSQCLS
ncbi:MAG: hypothetical protein OEY30_01020, partial [Candidatus Bathyarchaeota archaeon]|nr:hypothetical protein [Candidatus Bathyarchaeota archaeon]